MSNIQSVPSNGGGSVISRITAQTTYTSDFEQNNASNGPFRYGTYEDTNLVNNSTTAAGAFGNINFVTNNAIAMTVGGGTQSGKVGIGYTTLGTAALAINGNLSASRKHLTAYVLIKTMIARDHSVRSEPLI